MSGQAVITIRDKQWTVSVANTYAELASGLSGVASIPAGTGVFFDLGSDRSYIEVDMTQMLFSLDIVFINSTQGVVGVMHNVQPGATDVIFENNTLPGARCFLEINTGEAEELKVGDSVDIQGYAQPSVVDIPSLVNSMFTGMVIIMFIFMMSRMAISMLKSPEKTPRIEEKMSPPSEEIGIEEKRLSLEETGKKISEQAGKGVKFVELEEGWQPEYATVRYWFEDSEGNRIIATDLDELKWKLSLGESSPLVHHSPKYPEHMQTASVITDFIGDPSANMFDVEGEVEEAVCHLHPVSERAHGMIDRAKERAHNLASATADLPYAKEIQREYMPKVESYLKGIAEATSKVDTAISRNNKDMAKDSSHAVGDVARALGHLHDEALIDVYEKLSGEKAIVW